MYGLLIRDKRISVMYHKLGSGVAGSVVLSTETNMAENTPLAMIGLVMALLPLCICGLFLGTWASRGVKNYMTHFTKGILMVALKDLLKDLLKGRLKGICKSLICRLYQVILHTPGKVRSSWPAMQHRVSCCPCLHLLIK